MNERPVNKLSLSGLAATLIGNGIGRFAFIALMPALIDAGWFSKAEASYLSVSTLVGYVAGAWSADRLCTRFSVAALIRASMLICAASFFACAIQDAGLPWYHGWRLAAGFCGAVLMVLPAPAVLPRHIEGVRGRASGVVFSGIGLGAMISGALVPALVAGLGFAWISGPSTTVLLHLEGVAGAWLGMGIICLLLAVLSWRHWPEDVNVAPKGSDDAGTSNKRNVGLIVAAHSLNAVGYLAHTLFWVDYIVRELGLPLATGGFYWSMFGVGAAMGPLLTGSLADRLGLKRSLIGGFVLKAFAAALPLFNTSPAALLASSLLMGVFTPGIVTLISAYTLEQVGATEHRRNWGFATLGFAIAQAAAGLVMAMIAVRVGSYESLFGISAVALIGSILCICLVRTRHAVVEAPSAIPMTGPMPVGAAEN